MSLSDKEIDRLISKLREKYKDSAREYRSRLFNPEAFEDRLQTAIRRRMNLEGFILAEVANYEKIKERCEEERHPKTAEESPFSKEVNRIIEENAARISKYKEILFHPLADPEITHFYGALTEFLFEYFSILWIIINSNEGRDRVHKFENSFSDFASQKNMKHARRIDDHILLLTRGGTRDIEIEKDKNDYLKEAAFLLHEIVDFTEELINIKNRDWENPLRFDKLYVAGDTKKKMLSIFSGMTSYGAILKVKEQAEDIIKDFRLESFRKKTFV